MQQAPRAARAACTLVWLTLSICCAPAFGEYSYRATLQANYGPKNDLGGCTSNFQPSECALEFNSFDKPISDFALGATYSEYLGARGVDGPIRVDRSGEFTFGILVGRKLLNVGVSSGGTRNVFDCPKPGECYSAGASSYNTYVSVDVADNVLGAIPSSLDGKDVYFNVSIPLSVYGIGSSWGEVAFRLGDDSEYLKFGNQNVIGLNYSVDETLNLKTLVRSSDDASRTFTVPFSFYGAFNSASLNEEAYLNALHSIGMVVDLSEGLSVRSETGILDNLLSPVPEPSTLALMLAGLWSLSVATLRSRRRR